MDLTSFVKLRLLDTRSQANIDLREAPADAAGEAVQRSARRTLAWADAMIDVVRLAELVEHSDSMDERLDHQHTAYQTTLASLAEVWRDHPDYGSW